MREMIKILEKEETKFKPVLSTRKKMCKDCNLKEDCNKDLREKRQIVFLSKQKNCLVV